MQQEQIKSPFTDRASFPQLWSESFTPSLCFT